MLLCKWWEVIFIRSTIKFRRIRLRLAKIPKSRFFTSLCENQVHKSPLATRSSLSLHVDQAGPWTFQLDFRFSMFCCDQKHILMPPKASKNYTGLREVEFTLCRSDLTTDFFIRPIFTLLGHIPAKSRLQWLFGPKKKCENEWPTLTAIWLCSKKNLRIGLVFDQ